MCGYKSLANVAVAATVSPSDSSFSPPPGNPVHSSLAYTGLFPRRGLKERIVSTCPESVIGQSDQHIVISELHFIAGRDP